MVAKVIAHGHDRADAVRRLTRALEVAPLFGLRHNGRFLRDLLDHAQFTAAQLRTTRLDEWAASGEPLLQPSAVPEAAWRIAAAVLGGKPVDGVRPASVNAFDLTLDCDGERRTLRAPPEGIAVLSLGDGVLRCRVDGVHRRHPCVQVGATLQLAIDAAVFGFTEASPYPAVGPQFHPELDGLGVVVADCFGGANRLSALHVEDFWNFGIFNRQGLPCAHAERIRH